MKAAETDNSFKGFFIGVSILLLVAFLSLLLALTVGPLATNSAAFSLPSDSSTYLLAKYQMA